MHASDVFIKPRVLLFGKPGGSSPPGPLVGRHRTVHSATLWGYWYSINREPTCLPELFRTSVPAEAEPPLPRRIMCESRCVGEERGLLWLKGEGASSVCTCPKAAAKKQSEKPKSRDPNVCSHTPGRLAKLRPARERGGDVGS